MPALLAAALLLAGGCGGDEDSEPAGEATATATAAASPEATASPEQDPLQQAIWPPLDQAVGSPVKAARAFMADYVGVEDPALGEYLAGEPRAGEVEVFRRGEDGQALDTVVSVLSVRRLEGGHWYVTSAQSEEVEISEPEALASIASPVTVAGRGRGFEGNVVLEVRAAFDTEPLAELPVTAGSMAELQPFEAELEFDPGDAARGAILARTGSGISAADGVAAFPVTFAAP
jgi:hypothetical protein